MTFHVRERVLHFIYQHLSDVPDFILTICDAYEGSVKGRVGFNFPMIIVQRIDPKSILLSYQADYFIGYQQRDIMTKRHELQHAKYYMDSAFRCEVQTLWDSFSPTFQKRVYQQLLRMNYPNRPAILLDEFQAYYFTEKANFFGKREHTS